MSAALHELPAVPLDEALRDPSDTHKAMHGGAPVIMPELAVDLAQYGGCFVHPELGPYTVTPPYWRATKNDQVVHTTDLMRVWGLVRPTARPSGPNLVGLELEAHNIDPQTAEPVDVGRSDDHPELFRSINERATQPHSNLYTLSMEVVSIARALREDARRVGAVCLPDAVIGHRSMEPGDISDDPYIQRMVEFLGGPEITAGYTGTSVQRTYERTHGFVAGAQAANLCGVQHAQLETAYTGSSAFSDGSAHPCFPAPYDTLRPALGFRSTRHLGRVSVCPEAGPFRELLPSDPAAFQELVHRRMYQDNMPNSGRAGGQQADMRERVDHAPFGGHELCAAEPDGLHLESIMAFTALGRAKLYLMEKAFATGDIEYFARRYPRTMAAELTSQHLAAARQNGLVLAQQLPQHSWKVTALNGQQVSPDVLWNESLQMVQTHADYLPAPYRLHPQAAHWIMLRACVPDARRMPTDPQGYISLDTFYQGGRGTLAHYEMALYNQLMATRRYRNPAQAIAHVQLKAAAAWEAYMDKLDPEAALTFTANEEQGL